MDRGRRGAPGLEECRRTYEAARVSTRGPVTSGDRPTVIMPPSRCTVESAAMAFMSPLELELLGRIVLGFALGGVLGWGRERAGRPAGLRTHMLVTAGAAAYTIVSVYGFLDQ